MKFIPTPIAGVTIIEAEPFEDDRGVFRRHFDAKEFQQANVLSKVRQANVSENKFALTLRGFHYQLPPHAEAKTLSCIKGRMYDIAVDLRPSSPTYLKWTGIELTENNRKSFHIPLGCANAFLTLEPSTIIHYYVSQDYEPSAERGIRFNDPTFNFVWPETPKLISEKDQGHPDFNEAKHREEYNDHFENSV